MNKFYLVNYNKMFTKDTNFLIKTYLYGNETLKKIAYDVLLNEERLLDNDIDIVLINDFLEKIEIDDLWTFASLSKEYIVSQIAFEKIMCLLDKYDKTHTLSLIKIIK